MSLIYSSDMKKMTCNIVILSLKMIYLLYIKINNMKIYLKITVNVVILGSKITFFFKEIL